MDKLRIFIADLEKCAAFELVAEAADGGDETLLVQLPFENVNDLHLFREQLGAFGMHLSVLICSLKEALEFLVEYTRMQLHFVYITINLESTPKAFNL